MVLHVVVVGWHWILQAVGELLKAVVEYLKVVVHDVVEVFSVGT